MAKMMDREQANSQCGALVKMVQGVEQSNERSRLERARKEGQRVYSISEDDSGMKMMGLWIFVNVQQVEVVVRGHEIWMG